MKTHAGSCHCGAIKFEIDSDLAEFTKCDCTLCVKKNAVMVKVHENDFRLVAGKEHLGLYQWNTKVARHHFCKICGIYTFHHKRVTPEFLGINVFCLGEAEIATVPVIEVDGIRMPTAASGES
jgi:hypothetical protein